MELHQLRYFVAVAEAGSASRAAARCHVAQPSLSQQVMKLEQAVGKKLFDRLGRGMSLTEAGRAFLPKAKRILAEVRDAEAWAGRNDDSSLRVGAIPTMAPYFLPAALAGLRAKAPQCELTVREGLTESLAEAVIDGELDCALMSTPPADDRLDPEVFGEEELLAVIPAAWTTVPEGVLSLTELRERPAVLLEEVHCLGKQVDGFCEARRLAPRVVCRTTQLSTILEMVSLGLGYSLVPEVVTRTGASAGRRYARLTTPRPKRPLVLVWHKDRSRGRTSMLLLATLRELAQAPRRGA